MPLTPQYTWEETDNALHVTVRAPGLGKVKTDLLISDVCLRVSCQPYLLQLDLQHEVDEAQSSAVFGPSQLSIRLNKVVPGLWHQLLAIGSKTELHGRREDSLKRLELSLQQDHQAKLQQKQELERAAVDKRIEQDRQKRDAIEKLKQQELQAQREQVALWHDKADGAESDYDDEEAADVAPVSMSSEHEAYHGRGYRPSKVLHPSAIPDAAASSQCKDADQAEALQHDIWESQPSSSELNAATPAAEQQDSSKSSQSSRQVSPGQPPADTTLPPVRAQNVPVEVSFTQLETDHLPARETREQEISAHKAKAKVARADEDDMDMSERQPLFLKDKGDAMHRAGNYKAALNAYSKALRLDASLTACQSNRALTHLKLQDWRSCIEDCSTALAQLESAATRGAPESSGAAAVSSNMMVKLLTRRAAAHSQLLDLPAAAADLTLAQKLRPNDEKLQADMGEVQACLSAIDGASVKLLGNQRFKSQDVQGASEAFTVVLELPGVRDGDRLAAASNRAACHLAQAQYSSTVADCNLALDLLLGQEGRASQAHNWPLSEGAEKMTSPQLQSLARLLARRGAASGHLRRYSCAIEDLQAAQIMYRSAGQADKAAILETDMHKLKTLTDVRPGVQAVDKELPQNVKR